jgi:hypothetical protein
MSSQSEYWSRSELRLWNTCNADEVDAIAVPFPVRQIVAKVGTCNWAHLSALDTCMILGCACVTYKAITKQQLTSEADCFAVSQAADIIPHDFFVAEGWPTMHFGFLEKFLEGTAAGRNEERLALGLNATSDVARARPHLLVLLLCRMAVSAQKGTIGTVRLVRSL